MHIELSYTRSLEISKSYNIRVLLFNNSFEPVKISRNSFFGPNVKMLPQENRPIPESVESTFGMAEELLLLQPFSFYGRERNFDELLPGKYEISAYYLEDGNKKTIISEIIEVNY